MFFRQVMEYRLPTGLPNIDHNKLKIRTGLYTQVHINASITNTPKARTVGAIALYQAKENGSWYFLSLETGEQLHSNNWIEAPIRDDVIRRVNELGLQEGQTDMCQNGLVFELGPNEPMEDEEHDAEQPWNDDDDDDHDPNNDQDDEPVNHGMNQNPGGYMEEDVETPTHDEHEQDDNVEVQEREEWAPAENQERDPIDEETIENETSDNDEPVENRSAQDHDEHDDNAEETDDTNATSNNNDTPGEGVNVGGHNLRGNRDRNSNHKFTFLQQQKL